MRVELDKNKNIGIIGFGKIGKCVSAFFYNEAYQVNIFTRSIPDEDNCKYQFSDSLPKLIKNNDILINTLPKDAFVDLFEGLSFSGNLFLSYTIDLKLTTLSKYCSRNTRIQRIITSTAIKSGTSILLSTPSESGMLEQLFPSAMIIYLEEEMLILGTMLLSSSALSGLLINIILREIVSNGFPIDKAIKITRELPNELVLLGETWENDFGKVFAASATNNGITDRIGNVITQELNKLIKNII